MVPEGRGVFTRMTIHENLLMGAYTRNDKAGIEPTSRSGSACSRA
jgi:branched-chain amino acid transport system ATP-binding protein